MTTRQAPPLRTMLEELIATPSISSVRPDMDQGNRALIELLAQWLEEAGFCVDILALPGHPPKANLIAVLGEGSDGLVLAGHTDTVPYDAQGWQRDPLRLTEADGRFYGLGTSDMKSFLALAIEAARGLTAKDLRHPLTLLATADEESSMSGARLLAESPRDLGRYAVLGEPTSLRPVRLHKGVMGEAVRLLGRSGHASDPALGNSALEGMYEVMGEILAWRQVLQETHRHPAFPVSVPTLNFGHIQGGDNPNRICGACELFLDVRLLPGMAAEEVRAQLAACVARVARRRRLGWEVSPLFAAIPPAETPSGSAIVRACEHLTGQTAEAVGFGTEAPFFRQLGLETVILGPGNLTQAHQPDEYLEQARIPPTLELLRALIRRFCQT